MQPIHTVRHHLAQLAACAALSCLAAGSAAAFSLSGWEAGANAQRRVVATAMESEEPVVVYFQTNQCPWCRKLNDDYLNQAAVQRVLNQVRKVAVNPDNGNEEKALLQRYGANGTPAFYVYVPAFGAQPQRLTPFRKNDSDSPTQFAQKIAQAIAHDYDAHGYDLSTKGEDKHAIDYYQKALEYDPDNGYACHNLAVTYQRLAAKSHDAGLLAKAKEYYRRAVAIDPADATSQRALADLGDD